MIFRLSIIMLNQNLIIGLQYKQHGQFLAKIQKMRTSPILLCLALLQSVYSVVILQSSTTSTTIISPTGATTIYSAYYNSLQNGIAGTGVQWITSTKTASQIHYQTLFYASCIGSANLTITAASSFNAYLDGGFIGYGINYTSLYTFPIQLSCGNHNLTVIVYTEGESKSGLTFAIKQDQSACHNCQATGFWNEKTCSCSCINNQYTSGCKCTAPKVWKDYPTCGCGCPSLIIKPLPGAAAEANERRFFCLAPRYYSEETCSCVCRYQYCPPKYYFDPQTCSCFPYLT